MPDEAAAAPLSFADRLCAAIDRAGSPACVGIDPVVERLPGALRGEAPVRGIALFCRGVLAAARGVVPVVKFQSACFERYRGAGVDLLFELVAEARAAGFIVLIDAKRGDIGVTAEHYAAALFSDPGADAVTISGYLGPDTIEPFLAPGKGVFVLVRTSNPGSDRVQSDRLADGRTVAEAMADRVAALGASRRGACGLSDVGAVVGATKAADGAALRARMADQPFLVPGYGAQGGTLADLCPLLREHAGRGPGGLGVLITASRSVIYPEMQRGGDWSEAVGAAARSFAAELRGLGAGRSL